MRKVLLAVGGGLMLAVSVALSLIEVKKPPRGSVTRQELPGGVELSSPYYSLFVPKPWSVALHQKGVDSEGGVTHDGLAVRDTFKVKETP